MHYCASYFPHLTVYRKVHAPYSQICLKLKSDHVVTLLTVLWWLPILPQDEFMLLSLASRSSSQAPPGASGFPPTGH